MEARREKARDLARQAIASSKQTVPPWRRVKVFRVALGYTQDELAAQAGVSRATVSQIEAGEQRPQAGTARAIASALGLTSRELFGDFQSRDRPTSASATKRQLRRRRREAEDFALLEMERAAAIPTKPGVWISSARWLDELAEDSPTFDAETERLLDHWGFTKVGEGETA